VRDNIASYLLKLLLPLFKESFTQAAKEPRFFFVSFMQSALSRHLITNKTTGHDTSNLLLLGVMNDSAAAPIKKRDHQFQGSEK
jgi:hypothetical protein